MRNVRVTHEMTAGGSIAPLSAIIGKEPDVSTKWNKKEEELNDIGIFLTKREIDIFMQYNEDTLIKIWRLAGNKVIMGVTHTRKHYNFPSLGLNGGIKGIKYNSGGWFEKTLKVNSQSFKMVIPAGTGYVYFILPKSPFLKDAE